MLTPVLIPTAQLAVSLYRHKKKKFTNKKKVGPGALSRRLMKVRVEPSSLPSSAKPAAEPEGAPCQGLEAPDQLDAAQVPQWGRPLLPGGRHRPAQHHTAPVPGRDARLLHRP